MRLFPLFSAQSLQNYTLRASLPVIALAVVCLFPSAVRAQSPVAAEPPSMAMAALQQSQPADNLPYRLGRGDVLTINVQGRPELTGKQVVGPDGDITLPLVGSVTIADETRAEAAEAIRSLLLKFYTDPVVTVGVDAYNSNRILLVGSVEQPGVQVFDRPPTLLEVLARGSGGGGRSDSQSGHGGGGTGGEGGGFGGGYGGGFGGSSGSSVAKTLPEECIIYRGGATAIQVNVKKMLRSGSSLPNLRLQRDDIVYVPSSNDHYVSVMGQVQRPGSLPLDDETTLPRLLAMAGGPTQLAGHNPSIKIIEPATGTRREIAFRDLLKPNGTDVHLKSGDIVYVSESGFNAATYVLERLSPAVSIFTTAALLKTN